MSTNQGIFNRPDAEVLAHANTINSQCHQHEAEWGMEVQRLTQFDAGPWSDEISEIIG
jgi:hypothetical protein